MTNKMMVKKAAMLLLAGLLSACAAHSHKSAPALASQDAQAQPQFPAIASAVAATANQADSKQPADNIDDRVQIYPGTGVLVQAPPLQADTEQPSKSDDVMLNFDGADLREVVKAIVNDILRENYVIDPKVQGIVNLHTSKAIPRSALMATLEALLRMNGAAILKEAGVFKVVPAASAARGSITPQLRGGKPPVGYSVQIVPLSFISAKEMVKILEPFTTDASTVHMDELRNLLMLFGTELELKHLLETISMFDVDWLSGMSVGLFTLQSVDVKTAVADLDKIFGDNTQSPLSGLVRLVPIERMNAILAVTSQAKYLDQAKIWIERMDNAGSSSGGTRLFVYPVQNGRAEKLAELINQVFDNKSDALKPAAPPKLAPGLMPAEVNSAVPPDKMAAPAAKTASAQPNDAGTDSISINDSIRVIADKDNNALLVLASRADYEKIESAIRKLDIPQRQVLIDVTIAEITLTDEFKFGLEWYLSNGPHLSGKLDTGLSGISALVPGFSYVWANPAVPGNVGAALNALATNSKVKVISSPHIMVTDNQSAKISVGDQVPTSTQTQSVINSTTPTTPGVITNSVQYLDTGILLSVTPHINAGGMVTMEINQEVSKASKTDTSGIDSPTISKRSIQSTVVVKTGETMVLGGLITENKSKSTSGLPFLSTIPLVGGLFGTQGYTNDRTELVVMITPKLVSNSMEAADVTEEFRKKIGELADVMSSTEKLKAKKQK